MIGGRKHLGLCLDTPFAGWFAARLRRRKAIFRPAAFAFFDEALDRKPYWISCSVCTELIAKVPLASPVSLFLQRLAYAMMYRRYISSSNLGAN